MLYYAIKVCNLCIQFYPMTLEATFFLARPSIIIICYTRRIDSPMRGDGNHGNQELLYQFGKFVMDSTNYLRPCHIHSYLTLFEE